MKIRKNIKFRSDWLKKPMHSQAYRRWLVDNGSLTARLQQSFADFSVKPVNLTYAKPIADEVALLQQPPHRRALIREVRLMGDKKAVVFAHSVLPTNALRGPWNKLGRLGNKPLGATLFANPRVKRTVLTFKKLSQNHPLFKRAAAQFPKAPAYLWARRSIFSLNCANILVTEVFLPEILNEPTKN